MKIEITNEQEVYKKSSVVLSAIFAFVSAFGPMIVDSWNLLPDSLKEALPDGVAQWVAVAAFLLVIIGRYTHIDLTPKP